MKEFVKIPIEKISEFFVELKETMLEESDRKKLKSLINKGLAAISPILFSLILSGKELPFSTYPMGLALIAAARSDTLYFYIGALLFSIFSKNLPLFMGINSILVFRFIFSKVLVENPHLSKKASLKKKIFDKQTPFFEGETLRCATAALGGFTSGVLQLVAGGFSVGDLVGCCLYVVFCPLLAFVYAGFFSAAQKGTARYESGFLFLLVSFIFAFSDIKPFGISLSVILAAFITFLLVKRNNPLIASMFGLLAILPSEPLLSPAFAIAASVGALLYKRSKLYSVCAGSLSFAILTFFIGRVNLFASFFPEFILGGVLSFLINERDAENILPFFIDKTKNISSEEEILSLKEKKGRESIEDISKSFEELSKEFFTLSDKNSRIGIFDTRSICDRVCDKYCRRCALCSVCWERDYSVTLDTLNKISAKIYKNGRVKLSDLPNEFLRRCQNSAKLIEDIEKENKRVIRDRLKTDKTRAFAIDYAVFSRVLAEALEKNEEEYKPNKKARERLIEELSKINFHADSLGVFGERCKNIYALRLGKSAVKCKASLLQTAIERAISGKVSQPVFEFSDGGINMVCSQTASYEIKGSSFSFASKAGEENGDRVTLFEGKNSYFYALVNDGMGSGRGAARKSAAASVFLEKMLRAGNSVSSGIEMLASIARADGEEGFTTIDLFEFDEITGRGSFIKSGAAPSFVKRGTKLFKIRSKTFPLGILEDVDAERTTFECEDGDKIIMLSDGVTEDIDEPLWLCNFLNSNSLEGEDAAEKLLNEARQNTLCKDDMTAAVLTIKKKA